LRTGILQQKEPGNKGINTPLLPAAPRLAQASSAKRRSGVKMFALLFPRYPRHKNSLAFPAPKKHVKIK
jgi:hypothetical protein